MVPTTGTQEVPDAEAVFVVIPALNEEQVVGDVIGEVLGTYQRVVLVDDGSSDRTAEVAFRAGAHVLRHPFNLGQGAALQTGIDYATRNGAAFIVTFDADGQHDISDVAPMLTLLRESDADIVLGSRFLGKTEALPTGRRLLLKAAVLFTNATSSLTLTDTHNGLRVMTVGAARRIKLRQNGMAHASDLLAQVASLGLGYVEAPVRIRYSHYSMAKGQTATGALSVLYDLFVAWITR